MAERNTATVATHQKDYKSLEEIWNDLLQLHWNYLDTEENLQKLEMRKSLEGNWDAAANMSNYTSNNSTFIYDLFCVCVCVH